MQALPQPSHTGNLSSLKQFVNIDDDGEWKLFVAWLNHVLVGTGPYPVLAVHGEPGSAKSTLVRITRLLVDPNKAPLRSQPRDERDLVIAATNSLVVAYDHFSSTPGWVIRCAMSGVHWRRFGN